MLDIGGGMPVDYSKDDDDAEGGDGDGSGEDGGVQPSVYARFCTLLRARLPDLWAPGCGVQLVTENGRWVA